MRKTHSDHLLCITYYVCTYVVHLKKKLLSNFRRESYPHILDIKVSDLNNIAVGKVKQKKINK